MYQVNIICVLDTENIPDILEVSITYLRFREVTIWNTDLTKILLKKR